VELYSLPPTPLSLGVKLGKCTSSAVTVNPTFHDLYTRRRSRRRRKQLLDDIKEDAVNRKRKIARCEALALDEAMDMS
jgi:hypothetical protein